jgi:hypothetical protein
MAAFLLIVCIGRDRFSWANATASEEGSTGAKEERDLVAYTDKQIEDITASTAYKDADTEGRKRMISLLLKQLRKERVIVQYSYDKDGELFSFEYVDGSLGGVQLRDFDGMTNS